MLTRRLCVVDDDTFTWLAENNTELRARIRLDPQTRTVERGGLWYEESLPAESVLVGLVQVAGDRDDDPWGALDAITDGLLQFGGKASTGQGVARIRLHGGA
jgi:CRISPR-associated protein Cmr4